MAKLFNQYGMDYLNNGFHADSQKLFSHILIMLQKFPSGDFDTLMGLTLNNLSCSYKRSGQIAEAEDCLRRALELQGKGEPGDDGDLAPDQEA